MFPQENLHGRATDLVNGGEKCCHDGDALLPFALGSLRTRKPASMPASFIALPAPSFGIT